jgi:F-type H+-transporting ATPase subunit delta
VLKGAIARRYAEAILEIAIEQNTLDRWLADVRLIGEAFGNRQLAFVLREPKIRADRKALIVRDLLANKVQPEALNLALLLVTDNLVEIAPRLAVEFERLYNDYRGQAVAQVTTAVPLEADQRRLIAGKLQDLTGKRIILRERVDSAILGGVVARVGDTLIDGSVRRRLALLREQIIQGGGSFGGPLDGAPGPDGGDPPDEPAGGAGPFTVTPSAGDGGGAPSAGGPAGGPGAVGGPGPVARADRATATIRQPSPPRDAPALVLASASRQIQRNRRPAGRNKKRRR